LRKDNHSQAGKQNGVYLMCFTEDSDQRNLLSTICLRCDWVFRQIHYYLVNMRGEKEDLVLSDDGDVILRT